MTGNIVPASIIKPKLLYEHSFVKTDFTITSGDNKETAPIIVGSYLQDTGCTILYGVALLKNYGGGWSQYVDATMIADLDDVFATNAMVASAQSFYKRLNFFAIGNSNGAKLFASISSSLLTNMPSTFEVDIKLYGI